MIHFIPMQPADYAQYLEWAIDNYAHEQVAAGNWAAEQAREKSEQAYRELLPDGLESAGQTLCLIRQDAAETTVGYIWYGQRQAPGGDFMALYDFAIFEDFRRRGYAQQALQILENEARSAGLTAIRLHVFGHNHPARALYAKMGYVETNVNMRKDL